MAATLDNLGLILGLYGGRRKLTQKLTLPSACASPTPGPPMTLIASSLLQCWVSLVWDMSICNLSAGSDCLAPFLRTEVQGGVSGFIGSNLKCVVGMGQRGEVIWEPLKPWDLPVGH